MVMKTFTWQLSSELSKVRQNVIKKKRKRNDVLLQLNYLLSELLEIVIVGLNEIIMGNDFNEILIFAVKRYQLQAAGTYNYAWTLF